MTTRRMLAAVTVVVTAAAGVLVPSSASAVGTPVKPVIQGVVPTPAAGTATIGGGSGVAAGPATARSAPTTSSDRAFPRLDPNVVERPAPPVDPKGMRADAKARPEAAGQRGKPAPRVRTMSSPRLLPAGDEFLAGVDGFNAYQQRTSDDFRTVSIEPQSEVVCAGGGKVLQVGGLLMQVRDSAGNALTGTRSFSSFLGYPPFFDPATGYGPLIADQRCLYDPDYQRWYFITLVVELEPWGAVGDDTSIDVAVSDTPDPLGTWTYYRILTRMDGNAPGYTVTGCPCLIDWPRIGMDKYGIYITGELVTTGSALTGIVFAFALSKRKAAETPDVLPVTHLPLFGPVQGFSQNPYGVFPVQSPHNEFELGRNGTQYLVSNDPDSDLINLWALTNTRSLDDQTPALQLGVDSVASMARSYAPPMEQKPGPIPLAECLNDTTTVVEATGIPNDPPYVPGPVTGCRNVIFPPEFGAPPVVEELVLPVLDPEITRVTTPVFTRGEIWVSYVTGVQDGDRTRAGVGWYALRPSVGADGALSGQISKSGYISLPGNNVSYPALTFTRSGRGVMAVTIVGPDQYPSAGYVLFDRGKGPVGGVRLAFEGVGPMDGFTGYDPFGFLPGPKLGRWGDYSGAAVDGNEIWISSPVIAQSCTFAEYVASPFGTCDGTRNFAANWATRLSKLRP